MTKTLLTKFIGKKAIINPTSPETERELIENGKITEIKIYNTKIR